MTHKFGICLYMPDMPQNLGVIIRTAACLEFPLHIIKPLSFSMTDKRFKGAVMDYIDQCEIVNHDDWNNFEKYCESNNKRIVLATTKTNNSFYNYSFSNSDIILFGKETAGVPQEIHKKVIEKITIPINQKTRSLNLATSVSIIASQIISNL
ncbi:MAG: tRNA (cytidine(34)-2'-O)-methyltransferase [Alphaproteobacteria bacterium]|jgi:tRNA (cytidine/uridine-2'-O-)-methyltransferase|tara:strand:- start:84 stop:539 length:456 start_codon:yes stop_codon:yes gene_type:complete